MVPISFDTKSGQTFHKVYMFSRHGYLLHLQRSVVEVVILTSFINLTRTFLEPGFDVLQSFSNKLRSGRDQTLVMEILLRWVLL